MERTDKLVKTAALHDVPLEVSKVVATGLLQSKAVEIRPNEPFTWSSGWKSPIYCDNRLVLSYPVLRKRIIDGFQAIVESDFPSVDIIAGAATGGIAHAALLADRLGLRMSYVRGSAKGHGTRRRVEGKVPAGSRVIVIEDTLSTGKSAYDVVDALREEGAEVLAVCAIFSYDFDVLKHKVEESNVSAYRLLTYPQLMLVAQQEGYVTDGELQALLKWREEPDKFYSQHESDM